MKQKRRCSFRNVKLMRFYEVNNRKISFQIRMNYWIRSSKKRGEICLQLISSFFSIYNFLYQFYIKFLIKEKRPNLWTNLPFSGIRSTIWRSVTINLAYKKRCVTRNNIKFPCRNIYIYIFITTWRRLANKRGISHVISIYGKLWLISFLGWATYTEDISINGTTSGVRRKW